MAYPIGKRIIPPIVKFFWAKEINGLQNLPKKGPFIIAANHASYMDHFMMSLLIPPLNRKIHFLAKKEHFEGFFKMVWHTYAGAIPTDREKGGKETLKWAIKALKEGKIIGVHPEGTRSLTGKLQKAKTGVAQLALKAKVTIIPIGLIGTFEILPKGKYIPKLKKAVMNIGKPMYFNKYYNKPLNKKLLVEVTTKIMKAIAKLSNQRYDY